MPKRLLSVSHTPGLGSRFVARDTDGDSLEVRIWEMAGKSQVRETIVNCTDALGNSIAATLSIKQVAELKRFLETVDTSNVL